MINTTNWKEFRVGDLFDVHQLERVTDRGGYVPDNDIIDIDGQYPYLAAVSTNNGVKGYTNIKPNNDGNCITLSTTADSSNTIFYQPEPFIGRQQMAGIYKNNISQMNENIALFIISILRKQLMSFNYSNKLTFNALCDIKLLLPAINDKPDFDYMEEYIEEIKLKYVDKLEKDNNENIDKALRVTGLSYADLNKDLTVKPADRYEEFRVGNLFEIRPTKNHKLVNNDLYDINGINPVIANSGLNNGITGYTNLSCTERGNIITFSDTTDHNSIFYQPYDFVGYSHIQGLYPINHKDKWKLATLLYFMTVFKKMAASYSFSYGNKFTRYKAMDFKLLLPAIDENTPDFDYMEKAIYIYILQRRLNLKNYLTKRK